MRHALPAVVWPFVGRAAEVERVRTLLRTGRGAIVLAGSAGVGKTRLATECLAVGEHEGYVPLRVAATQSAAALPFGAFASLVPDLAPGTDRLEVLRQIAHVVAGRGEGRPVMVLVDDAHLLDDASAALAHLLATAGTTFLLVTIRSGETAPDPILALWKDGLAERLEVEPFTAAQVSDVLAAALSGPLDGAAAHLLWKRTEGNALFLREVVLGAVEGGVLRQEEGVWRLRGLLPTSSRLVEIIQGRLGKLDDQVRRTLGVLALGEPLEVELLQAVNPKIDLESLELRGLVDVERSDRRFGVRLHHPLYGEFLRTRLSPLRARDSARALAAALGATGARRREDGLRLATWSLDGGSSLQPDVMLAAAVAARRRHDYRLAGRLARAAVAAGAGFDASLLLGQVRWLQGRAEEAEAELGGLVDIAATDAQRALLATVRMNVLDFGLKRADLALEVAEEAEATIADAAFRDQITADRARILGRSGNYRAAIALATPLLKRASGRALVSACFAAATSLAAAGQTAGAIEATKRGLAVHLSLTGPPLPFGPHFHLMIRGAALNFGGWLAEAGALAGREYDKAIEEESVEAQAWFSWILGWVALNEGRAATAASLTGESAAAFREFGWRLFVRCALMLRAHALALRGEAESARRVLEELDALGVPAEELGGPELLRARACTAVAAGDVGEGRRHLNEAVEMARRGGGLVYESAALHDLARLGWAAEVHARLRELAAVVEGPLAPARASHAAALSARNPVELENASVAFEEFGAILLAAEAAADAAVVWRREGDPRRAAGAARRSSELAVRCEGARTPPLVVGVRAVLTARELEIARLAATGLGNKEIAGRLLLSRRTVENKLHAAYEKLGVSGREALRHALGSH